MSKEEQELSKVTYHAGNLIPNVIPSPKLAKPKKVSQDEQLRKTYREMLEREANEEEIRSEREANETPASFRGLAVPDFPRRTSGRRSKAQIQQDFIAEELRRQEAGQRIARQNGHSIIPICECDNSMEHTKRKKVRGKMRTICLECELEKISDVALSL